MSRDRSNCGVTYYVSRSATSEALTLSKVHNDSGKGTVKYDRAQMWNETPYNERNIDKYQQFKKICKQFQKRF